MREREGHQTHLLVFCIYKFREIFNENENENENENGWNFFTKFPLLRYFPAIK